MRTVALYGNSLVVSSIGASLQGRAELQVSFVDAALPDAASQLTALQPDVIISDLAMAHPEFAIALWKAQPRLLLIVLAIYVWQRRSVPGARVFAVACLIAAPWAAGATMEVAAVYPVADAEPDREVVEGR